jgi:para-aminobenzoate synthetase
MSAPEKARILFIDAYDSFSNNIISLLETELNASVRVIPINHGLIRSDSSLKQELSHYDAVVCGPGPGHPEVAEDVGIMRKIWRLGDDEMLPVLGICLGFQSLCWEFRGTVRQLNGPQHGIVREIRHAGQRGYQANRDIFEGVGCFKATLYQSLCVDIGHDPINPKDWPLSKWQPTKSCPDLVPLAWVENDGTEKKSGIKDERVLVGVRHRAKPFWALQYHPESICSDEEGRKVIKNWFEKAKNWNTNAREGSINKHSPRYGRLPVGQSLICRFNNHATGKDKKHHFIDDFEQEKVFQSITVNIPALATIPDIVEAVQDTRRDHIILESSNIHEVSSGSADVKGRYSIIGLDIDDALRFEYTTATQFIKVIYSEDGSQKEKMISLDDLDVWEFLAGFLEKRKIKDEDISVKSPFCGGFMGYTTYELGLEGIKVELNLFKDRKKVYTRPDLCFAWVTRSLVIDHVENKIHIQALTKDPEHPAWMGAMETKLDAMSRTDNPHTFSTSQNQQCATSAKTSQSSLRSAFSELDISASSPFSGAQSSASSVYSVDETDASKHDLETIITSPSNDDYEEKVQHCKYSIRTGDSYELCLTDQTIVQLPRSDRSISSLSSVHTQSPERLLSQRSSWQLYRALRTHQPAPFASYLRLGALTFVSSSPERFLTYDHTGLCQLRPMKGTVRKTPSVANLQAAEKLLHVPKEIAENLMIVDLVRHDLYSICGSGHVSVPRLMVIEEYSNVFQMVSVVQGQLPVIPRLDPLVHHLFPEAFEAAEKKRYTGLDILAASLPPGSMTGAPKKRSCEILQVVERKERGMYSGVVGYMDVRGRGDWSVSIRCMFRWDDEDTAISPSDSVLGRSSSSGSAENKVMETWHVGAGGAVTILSTPVGEREEMQTKLNGTLGVFR